jgi:hypothetical protein
LCGCAQGHPDAEYRAPKGSRRQQQLKRKNNIKRRNVFTCLAAAPLLAANLLGGQEPHKTQKLKIMMKSAWGLDDPTRASFPFVHGLALASPGHDVQIFLIGEGIYTMRKATVDTINPVGWPPLCETMKGLSPSAFGSLLEEPVPGPVGPRKQI